MNSDLQCLIMIFDQISSHWDVDHENFDNHARWLIIIASSLSIPVLQLSDHHCLITLCSYLIKSLYHTLMIKSHIILEKSSTQTKRKTNWLVKQFDYPKISLVIIRYSEPLRRSLYLIIWKLFLYHLESNVMMITAGIIAAKILKIIIIAI